MKIQSLSVVVPTIGCMNSCKFCVSRMHTEDYENKIGNDNLTYSKEYRKRLEFARDNNCNVAILTGQGEPQQNPIFLKYFGQVNKLLSKPFRIIEIQTTGAKLNPAFLKEIGVTTVSLSVSCLNDEKINSQIINNNRINIPLRELIADIKNLDMNVRLSLNMTDKIWVDEHGESFPELNSNDKSNLNHISDVLYYCRDIGADQVTFRKMYATKASNPQSEWLAQHNLNGNFFHLLSSFIEVNGRYLDTLEYGAKRYSFNGMSCVIDNDCMAKEKHDGAIKYLVLRPNCKLYTQWDDKGSLIF